MTRSRGARGLEGSVAGVAGSLAVARTGARSVVMSAGGQAADYYHCMNMNETRRRRRRQRRRRRGTRTRTRGVGRTLAEKDVRIGARLDPTESVAGGGEGETREGRLARQREGTAERRRGRPEREANGGVRMRGADCSARGENAKGAAFN